VAESHDILQAASCDGCYPVMVGLATISNLSAGAIV
jgi:hypothetical protein